MPTATGKEPADDILDAVSRGVVLDGSVPLPAADAFPKEGDKEYPAYEARMADLREALMWGFYDVLALAFPARYKVDDVQDPPLPPFKQMLEDIEYASGYKFSALCNEETATYKDRQKEFDVFGETHKMVIDPPFCFHGSSYESVEKIYNDGFDLALCTAEGAYGGGPGMPCAYVSQYLREALVYSRIDEKNMLWVVYGRAHIGDPEKIPVGSKGQIDFGVYPDGRPILTTTNANKTYWCMSQPRQQFCSEGFVGFRIASKLSDFALLHMTYPPAVWKRMTEEIPELVAYKQGLVAKAESEGRKAHRQAAWAAQVGRRKQPPRAAKSKQGQ
jgi:hypothetical protein